jgi:hypothetical protein
MQATCWEFLLNLVSQRYLPEDCPKKQPGIQLSEQEKST